MTPEDYLKKIQVFSNGTLETGWFFSEVSYYAAIGRVLESLRPHLKFGCNIDRGFILGELGFLLRNLVNLSSLSMYHGFFLSHDWSKSREMVPAGVNGCANSILNMLKTDDTERRTHFLANACSHLGFTFEVVAARSLEDAEFEFSKKKAG